MNENQKAINKMMEQFPPGTPVPPHIIVNGTCYHPGLIEIHQKLYVSRATELEKCGEDMRAVMLKIYEAEDYIKQIEGMQLISRLLFLFSGRLPLRGGK